MKKRWFERETPLTEQAGPILVRWFQRAERLQFVSIRRDPGTGTERPGLCFTVGIRDLAGSPRAICLVEKALAQARGSSSGDGGCNMSE